MPSSCLVGRSTSPARTLSSLLLLTEPIKELTAERCVYSIRELDEWLFLPLPVKGVKRVEKIIRQLCINCLSLDTLGVDLQHTHEHRSDMRTPTARQVPCRDFRRHQRYSVVLSIPMDSLSKAVGPSLTTNPPTDPFEHVNRSPLLGEYGGELGASSVRPLSSITSPREARSRVGTHFGLIKFADSFHISPYISCTLECVQPKLK